MEVRLRQLNRVLSFLVITALTYQQDGEMKKIRRERVRRKKPIKRETREEIKRLRKVRKDEKGERRKGGRGKREGNTSALTLFF